MIYHKIPFLAFKGGISTLNKSLVELLMNVRVTKKGKNTVLDFEVPTDVADQRFKAPPPGSVMGLGASNILFSHTLPVYLPQIFPCTHSELV